MKRVEYVWKDEVRGIVNVLLLKKSDNSKLGGSWMIGTYHFSEKQVLSGKLDDDEACCMDCPLSYGSGDRSCYTHKGLMKLGLLSMLRRLKRIYDTIGVFSQHELNVFVARVCEAREKLAKKGEKIDQVRFGVYGEPVLLNIKIVDQIAGIAKHQGYTHQWTKVDKSYSAYFMASTHNVFEAAIANDMGYRTFNVGQLDGAVNCPASKEAGRKTTCSTCNLCNGTNGNSKKNIYIKQH